MRQRLDIADVEARTKIRAKYLRALENEEFGMLPGPTFVKTFLRTYAEMLGLDPHVLVEEYRAGFEREDEMEAPLGPPAVAGRDRRHGPRIGPGSIILLVLVAVVAVLVAIGLASDDSGDGGQASAPTPETTRSETKAKPAPKPPKPRRVSLRVTPSTPTTSAWITGSGTPVVFENTIDSAQTFRGKRLRVNLGKRDVQLRMNGKPVEVTPGADPVGFRVHAAREPRAPGRRAPLCVVSGAVSARAGIVVTGTEVLTGRIQDRNGPWLSDRLLELGVELAHITICGDRPEDIEAQLRFLADQGVDLILTSGGLGPTADDMTVEMVARFCERELVLDEELEEKIAGILKPLMARFSHWDFEAVRAANRKQALVPEGSYIIDPVGTAPGVVVPGEPTVVVLPGPPRELQPMWRTAVNTDAVQEAIAGRTTYLQETVRMFGLPESGLADTLRDAEEGIGGFEALEITTCLRRGEIEMVTRYEPEAADTYMELLVLLRERHGREIFSEDGSRVDDLVAQLLAGRRWPPPSRARLGCSRRA